MVQKGNKRNELRIEYTQRNNKFYRLANFERGIDYLFQNIYNILFPQKSSE